MKMKWVIVTALLCVTVTFAATTDVDRGRRAQRPTTCPRMCQCNVFNGLNKADCSGHQLIDGCLEISADVEILDLRGNDITTVSDNCFATLKHLANLKLANNAIDTIFLDAFKGMPRLELIDLSANRLESFDDRIFEHNPILSTVDLSGNMFMNLQDKPLLRSKSIRTLLLGNSKIFFIYPSMFEMMPNLVEVNLSGNLLITLNVQVFKRNRRLQFLNLEENKWNCDASMERTLTWLKTREVDVTLTGCPVAKHHKEPSMFERMEVHRNHELNESSEEDTADGWSIYPPGSAHKCQQNDTRRECHLLQPITSNTDNETMEIIELIHRYSFFINATRHVDTKFLRKTFLSEFALIFYAGVIFGGICCCCCFYCSNCWDSQKHLRRREEIRMQRRENFNKYRAQLIRSNSRAAPSIVVAIEGEEPVCLRDEPIPRCNRLTAMVVAGGAVERSSSVRSNRPPPLPPRRRQNLATYLSQLFARQSRRRYVKQTTNLVRRLSRSTLFLNRQNSRPNPTTRATSQSERLLTEDDHMSVSRSTVHSEMYQTPVAHQSLHGSATLYDEPIIITDRFHSDFELNRDETPPPSYVDVVPYFTPFPNSQR